MATVTLQANAFNTTDHLPEVETTAPNFTLVETDLSGTILAGCIGSKLVLNILPYVNFRGCASSFRTFNQKTSDMDNIKVLCVSAQIVV